jgi:hypothetical protein
VNFQAIVVGDSLIYQKPDGGAAKKTPASGQEKL